MDCRWNKWEKRVLSSFNIFNFVGQKDAHAYVVLPSPLTLLALSLNPLCDILSAFVLFRVFNKNLKLRLFQEGCDSI